MHPLTNENKSLKCLYYLYIENDHNSYGSIITQRIPKQNFATKVHCFACNFHVVYMSY